MLKQVDYEETIKMFFVSVDAFLYNSLQKTKDKKIIRAIRENRHRLTVIMQKPGEFTNPDVMVNNDLELTTDGMVLGEDDELFRVYNEMISALVRYYASLYAKKATFFDEDAILDLYKKWVLLSQRNKKLKQLWTSLRKPESFAEKVCSVRIR